MFCTLSTDTAGIASVAGMLGVAGAFAALIANGEAGSTRKPGLVLRSKLSSLSFADPFAVRASKAAKRRASRSEGGM